MKNRGVIETLYNEVLKSYKGSKEEWDALEKIEELNQEIVKKYGKALNEFLEKLEELYMCAQNANSLDLFALGFVKGILLEKETQNFLYE